MPAVERHTGLKKTKVARLRLAALALLVASLAAAAGLVAAAVDNLAPDLNRPPYGAVALRPSGQDFSALGLTQCVERWEATDGAIVAACREPRADSAQDYGLRVFALVREGERHVVRSRSAGAGDAYGVRLSMLRDPRQPSMELVLAEFSAEFSYGVWVFRRDREGLRKLGEIDLGIDDGGGGVASVVPAMKVAPQAGGFVVTFDRDVVRPLPDGRYAKVRKDQIRYVFRGATLEMVRGRPPRR